MHRLASILSKQRSLLATKTKSLNKLTLIPSSKSIVINRNNQFGYERPKNDIYCKAPYTLLPTQSEKKGYISPDLIPKDQAQTRIMYVLKKFSFIDTQTIDLKQPFSQLQMDSLDVISVITSIQYEFNTVFEDNVFDKFDSFQDVAQYVSRVSGMI